MIWFSKLNYFKNILHFHIVADEIYVSLGNFNDNLVFKQILMRHLFNVNYEIKVSWVYFVKFIFFNFIFYFFIFFLYFFLFSLPAFSFVYGQFRSCAGSPQFNFFI